MFIIERALNIFTLIYELEASIALKESGISRIGLDNQPTNISSVIDSSVKVNPAFRAGFIPNQLILNASLINELSQESSSGDKNVAQSNEKRLRKSEVKPEDSDHKQYRRRETEKKDTAKPSEALRPSEKGQPQNIPNLELSRIDSPDTLSTQQSQQKHSSSSSFNSHPQPQHKSSVQGQSGSKDRSMPASSPRFVRINNNLVDNSFNSHRMQDPVRGMPSVASPVPLVYNNTNIQGVSWRNIWSNSNIAPNGGMGEVLASPLSSRPQNMLGASSPQQMQSPKSYSQANSNSRYTITPNPSVVRYIEQKSAEGLASPIGFSPLASPTYRKNISQGRANNGASPKSNLNNLTFSYKG
ncbi:hypothetical protein OIY81_904 [Cryptosporidium canis]|uniref:Uncharacterized protein n=1 Tax=Cryptosporidium canis TaxID=195482 RepID=A0ABQ8PBW4_9CRYT|nr:hypothetical protein OIY81_904 [Cryptosporidium canis]KAJ1615446.1 hypothetical protein OJ252_88 [Cryptosporidium canis]